MSASGAIEQPEHEFHAGLGRREAVDHRQAVDGLRVSATHAAARGAQHDHAGRLRDEVAAVKAETAAGGAVPEIAYADVAAGRVSEAAKARVRRRGCVVIRAVFERAQVEAWNEEVVRYIDEVGYLSYSNRHADLLFELISRRYERGPMILTSNQSFGAWGEVFGDRVIATAILDRLLHHAVTLNIRGNSYRLKEKLKAGLVRSDEPDPQPGGEI